MRLEWVAHPARARPGRTALAVGVIQLAALLAYATGGAWLAALAEAVLLASIAPFLFPTRYVLCDERVCARRLGVTRARRWSELRRFQAGAETVLLSPFARPSWLDRTRGLVVFFAANERDVMAIVRDKIR